MRINFFYRINQYCMDISNINNIQQNSILDNQQTSMNKNKSYLTDKIKRIKFKFNYISNSFNNNEKSDKKTNQKQFLKMQLLFLANLNEKIDLEIKNFSLTKITEKIKYDNLFDIYIEYRKILILLEALIDNLLNKKNDEIIMDLKIDQESFDAYNFLAKKFNLLESLLALINA